MTGATGQISRPLSEHLIAAGYDLVVLSRDPEHARCRMVPRQALDLGYPFRFGSREPALPDLLRP